MKQGIHPDYVECKVTCGCGSSFTTGATVTELRVDICSACHPFYTGKQKFVDTAGRVEKFRQRYAQSKPTEATEATEAPEAPEAPEVPEVPEAPEAPEASEAPEVPEVPEAPEAPEATEAPEAPED